MKTWGKLFLLAVLCVFFTGCVRFHALIKLQESGGGQLFLRCLLSESLDDGKNTTVSDEKIDEFTATLGEGVRLVERTKLDKKGWKGFTLHYEFEDINKLRLPIHEFSEINSDDGDENNGSLSFAESGPWRFRYVPGVDKVIAFHEQEEGDQSNDEDPFAEAGVDLPNAPEADFGSALAVGFLKPMLQEARFTVTLQVGENIVETNAPAKPTPRSVHLFDADLKKFANSKEFEEAIIGKWTIEKLIREKVDGIHGLPSDKEITVKFE